MGERVRVVNAMRCDAMQRNVYRLGTLETGRLSKKLKSFDRMLGKNLHKS